MTGWFLYKRNLFEIVSSAYTIVTLDCRSKRFGNALKNRILCRTCEGLGGNVGYCSHGTEILNRLYSISKRSDSAANVCLGMSDDGKAGYVQIKEHQSTIVTETCSLYFVSKEKRNVFSRISEERVMHETMEKIIEL